MFWLRYPTENGCLHGFLFQVGGPRGLLTFTLQAYPEGGGWRARKQRVHHPCLQSGFCPPGFLPRLLCLKRSPWKVRLKNPPLSSLGSVAFQHRPQRKLPPKVWTEVYLHGKVEQRLLVRFCFALCRLSASPSQYKSAWRLRGRVHPQVGAGAALPSGSHSSLSLPFRPSLSSFRFPPFPSCSISAL